jgi:hypothetical protein
MMKLAFPLGAIEFWNKRRRVCAGIPVDAPVELAPKERGNLPCVDVDSSV